MCQSSGSRGAPRRPALAGGALEGEAGAPLTARYSRSAGGCVRRGLFRIMAFAFKVRLRRLCTSNLVVDHPRGQTRAGATGGSDLATHQGGLQHKGSPRPRLISLPPHTHTLSRSHSLRALAGAGRQTSDWGDSVSSHKRLKAEGSKSVMCQSSGSRGARVGKGVGQTGGRVPAALVSIQIRS